MRPGPTVRGKRAPSAARALSVAPPTGLNPPTPLSGEPQFCPQILRKTLFFLPPYSPELNPDELVWNHLKTHGVRKRLLQTPEALKRYVLSHMRSLQGRPALLRGFFKKPSLRYITA